MYAIYDNAEAERREVWAGGRIVALVTKEVLGDEVLLQPLMAHPDPMVRALVTAGPWNSMSVLGDLAHIPLPYRP